MINFEEKRRTNNLKGDETMESTKFPIVIKKRNGIVIAAAISEIAVGIIFGITQGGLKNILLWVFLFVGIITALSCLGEYKQDILLKENKIEFYNNNDLIKAINYSNIKSICIDKGNETKTKRKDFFTIGIGGNKSSKDNNYQINPMNYGAGDLAKIKDIIVMKNSSVKVSSDINKMTRK